MTKAAILLQPRAWWSVEMDEGDVYRLTVVDGQQVPDFTFFARDDFSERLSPTNTQLLNGSFVIGTGHNLYSNRARPLLRIIDGTVHEGVIVGGSCSEPANYARFGIRGTPNCRSNLLQAGRPYGLEEPDISHIYCPFMTIRKTGDGGYIIDLPKCGPGDYVELQAVVPVLALTSNCPQERAPTNAFNPTRLHAWVGRHDASRPTLVEILGTKNAVGA